MKTAIWVILLGLVGWGAYSFATSNDDPVTLELLITTYAAVPLWAALVGAAAVGGLAVLFALSPSWVRLRLRTRRQARSIAELEQEVHGLRTLPLGDEMETAEAARER